MEDIKRLVQIILADVNIRLRERSLFTAGGGGANKGGGKNFFGRYSVEFVF